MSKSILLFPGQGSQYVGMQSPYQNSKRYDEIWASARDILSKDLESIIKDGPEAELNQTENTQPALFIISMLGLDIIKEEGVAFDYVAGHSLGEYSALCAAQVLSFEDTLKLVKLRGELMATAGIQSPGSMSAILGLDRETIDAQLQKLDSGEKLVVANYNSPSQTVISGDTGLIDEAEKSLLEAGAKKVVRLPVSGAFHSPLMQFAVEGLTEAINTLEFKTPAVPIIQNSTSEIESDPEKIKKALLAQITSPVRWVESILAAVNQDCSSAVEVGPGKVLMGLGRAISRDLKITPVEKMQATVQ